MDKAKQPQNTLLEQPDKNTARDNTFFLSLYISHFNKTHWHAACCSPSKFFNIYLHIPHPPNIFLKILFLCMNVYTFISFIKHYQV